MTTLTQSEFARQMNFKRSYVTQLKNEGRLIMAGKLVDVEASIDLIESTRDPSKKPIADMHQANRESAGVVDRENDFVDVIIDNQEQDFNSYQQSRAKREHYAALQAQMQYEKEIGRLLDVDQVVLAVASGDAVIRNRLESMRDVLAPQLSIETDIDRIKSMITDYVDMILAELSRDFNKMAMHK